MTNRSRQQPRPLMRGSEEWIVGRRPAPFLVEKPKPFRPHLILLMDPGLDLAVDTEAVPPDTPADEAARWVASALGEQNGLPVKLGRPLKLRVEDEAFAAALRARLEPKLQVVSAPTPEVDRLLEHLGEYMSGRGEPTTTGLPGDSADTRALPRFFEAAAALYRLAPWQEANDSQVLRLDAPDLGWEGACISIIGMLGESRGLLVYRSIENYLDFTRFAGAHTQTKGHPGLPPIHLFSINFDKPREAPAGLVRMARKQRWDVAGKDAFPYVLHIGRDGMALPLHESDFRFATACLIGLAHLLRKRRGIFSRPLRRPAEAEFVLKELPGAPKMRLTVPHPEATWRWGEETVLQHLHETEARALREAFLADARTEGRPDEWIEGADWIVEQFLAFKVGYREEAPLRWTVDLVEEFLLDHFPRKANATDAQIEALPEYVRSFLEWLGRTGREPARIVERLVERVGRLREAFLREARNPAHFGIAKTLAKAMEREGADFSDDKAVNRFMADFNERLRDDPSLLPTPFDIEGAGGSRVRKVWVWTPGTPAPDPMAPCPCGSGRRYKKCCLPR